MNKTLPIWRDATNLLLEIEQAVKHFPRYHKYTLGSELRTQAMLICRLTGRAWRDKSSAQHWLEKLVPAVDDLKIQLQLAKELQVFRNFAEFERLATLTVDVGKQSGGWLRRLQVSSQSEISRKA
ncbi:MAG: four helix bundle protein [Methylovulum sp.]|nr:four helix bundle protein [Methylovulum sp.]